LEPGVLDLELAGHSQGDPPKQKRRLLPQEFYDFAVNNAALKKFSPTKSRDLFTPVHIILGRFGRNRGEVSTGTSPDFFFTKRSNPIKIRATYETGVPIQESNLFEFLAEAESFWELLFAVFGEDFLPGNL